MENLPHCLVGEIGYVRLPVGQTTVIGNVKSSEERTRGRRSVEREVEQIDFDATSICRNHCEIVPNGETAIITTVRYIYMVLL